MADRIGDAPIEAEYEALMRAFAENLHEILNGEGPRKNGFVLLVFPFGEEGRCNYISNANREDVIVLLKEQLARFEGQPVNPGKA